MTGLGSGSSALHRIDFILSLLLSGLFDVVGIGCSVNI